eukprot:COSAG01_NODE_13172_length_1625_cov_1.523591_2_plen_308_part_00
MRAGDVRLGACALLLLAAVATADRPWKYTACPGKQEQGNHAGVMCKGLSEAQLCGQEKVTAGSAEVVFGDREKHLQRYKAMKLTLDMAGSDGCYVTDPQGIKVTDPELGGKIGEKLRQKCYCGAKNKCSQYPPYTSENIQQEWNTRYAFFNTKTKSCEEYGRDERVTPGCVPFTNMEKCSLACHKYSSDTAGELEEEAEEDAIEFTKFAFHAFIMLYMCFGLALVCEDFFVASLEIIIDKLKLPPRMLLGRLSWRRGPHHLSCLWRPWRCSCSPTQVTAASSTHRARPRTRRCLPATANPRTTTLAG